ncbi:MAG: cytochrome b/b6 domain-containing protein [Chitinophagales bacterium]
MSGARPTAPPGRVLRHPLMLRLIHWIHVATVAVLALSGFYVSRPFLPTGVLRISDVRLAHLTTAPLLVATWVLYAYFLLVSGAYRDLLPSRADLLNLGGTLRYELLLTEELPPHAKYHIFQKLLYLSFFPVIAGLAFTGWALAVPSTRSASVVVLLAGDLQRVRIIHYALALYLTLTGTLHFYRVLTEPHTMASMVTGWALAVPPSGTRAEKASRPRRLQ